MLKHAITRLQMTDLSRLFEVLCDLAYAKKQLTLPTDLMTATTPTVTAAADDVPPEDGRTVSGRY